MMRYEYLQGQLDKRIVEGSVLIGLRGSATVYGYIYDEEDIDLLLVSDTLDLLTVQSYLGDESPFDCQVLTTQEFQDGFINARLEVTEALINLVSYDEEYITPYLTLMDTDEYDKLFELECFLVLKNQIKQMYKGRPSKFYSKALYLYLFLRNSTYSCLELYKDPGKRIYYVNVYRDTRYYGTLDFTVMRQMQEFRDDDGIKEQYMHHKQGSQRYIKEQLGVY